MAGEREEVGTQLVHVHAQVRHGLRGVDDHHGADRVRGVRQPADGQLDAHDVGDVRRRDDARARPDLLGDLRIRERAGLLGIEIDEARARLAAGLLPRDQVGVVLHHGDGDLVAGFEHGGGEGLGHDVQALGGVAGEDHLAWVARADKARDLGAHLGDGLGGLDGERVQAAQRVCVHGLVELFLGGEHAGGALCGGGAIEKSDLGLARQQREVRAVRVLPDVHLLGLLMGQKGTVPN